MIKILNEKMEFVSKIGAFEFSICFGFRYSDFGFTINPIYL
jgi:hypothetical protein